VPQGLVEEAKSHPIAEKLVRGIPMGENQSTENQIPRSGRLLVIVEMREGKWRLLVIFFL
jgi:hypothetical protein